MSRKPEFNFPKKIIIEQQVDDDDDDDIDVYINQDELNQLPSESQTLNLQPFPNLDFFVDSADSLSRSTGSNPNKRNATVLENEQPALPVFYVDPNPFVSNQFYTFNRLSYDLMIDCILAGRYATPDEIRNVTPALMLDTWRNVWKDRNEDTGFVTAWKRIQVKMNVHIDAENGNRFLFFKNYSRRFVSFIEQWQDIVMTSHCGGDSRHLGIRDTIERIRKMWTVNVKFYGVPESYIRVCVKLCPVCCDSLSGSAPVGKRRKFEYTESFEVPVKEVEMKLQELATKYKAVLCVKQKYIRQNPYLAEVKDYTCDRAGEPMSNNWKDSKKESHMSQRCGCNFRIRVIVPVSECNNEGKAFVCQDEGVAVFKLFAVHSGHEPGASDGDARIMHSVAGNEGGLLMDQDVSYGVREDEEASSGQMMTVFENSYSLSSYLEDIISVAESILGKLKKIPLESLGSASQDAFEALNKLRRWEDPGPKQHSGYVLVGETDLEDWGHDQMISGKIKPVESIEDSGNSFGRTLGNSASCGQVKADCRDMKD